jgi:hypothetical protein
MGICGTSVANRRQEEELQATAVAVSMVVGKKRWGGSVIGHKVKNCEREEVNAQIMRDYFNDPPLYGEEYFRRM